MSSKDKKKLSNKSTPALETNQEEKENKSSEKSKKRRAPRDKDLPAKRRRLSSVAPEDTNTNTKGTPIRATGATKLTTSSGHVKKEFQRNDMDANLIRVPRSFSSLEEVTAEINSWRTEGDSYKSIVTELGRILLDGDDTLDADLSDDEARQLFPSDSPTRATRLTSAAFLRILGSIAPNNEVEWLAELHHPVQECFKEFVNPGQSVIAASFGNAVIAQTTKTDQRLKPDRVFGWNALKSLSIDYWVGTIQIPFVVIESKPASKQDEKGDLFKKFILEAKAYEHQEACREIYDISSDFKTTICLPLVFGMYMVGAQFTFDIYRVIDGTKKPLTFDPIDFRTHPQRVLRAIIAIKKWARELRENMVNIERKFGERFLKNGSEKEDDDESDRGDTDYKEYDDEDDSEDRDGGSGEQSDDQGSEQDDSESKPQDLEDAPSDCIQLHQSSKTSVVARFDKRRGCYVVTKKTVAEDGIREADLLKGKLKSLSFVPQLLGFAVNNDEATLTMSWHTGQHPQGFTQHRELKRFLKTLLKRVNQIHKRGIVHNDLKEANVLWDSNTLTIIDFGGADTYPSYSTVGTRGYVAPDALRTPASDVYSCGVMFFNLLLNISISSSEQVTYLRRCNSVQDIEERISPFLPVSFLLWHTGAWDLAKRMTDPNPNRRITIKKALQNVYLE
jgi:tRNA A-37 threonylcarbamoyl transferase component Bud32